MERNPPIYLWESGQFKGLRHRISPLIFWLGPKFINKKIGRLWGSAMGKISLTKATFNFNRKAVIKEAGDSTL